MLVKLAVTYSKKQEDPLKKGIDNLQRQARQKSSSWRGAARTGSTKEHFDEFVGRLKPKKMILRALAKANRAMPDAKKHPNLNRAARVLASATSDVAHAAKSHPKAAIGIAAGATALTIASLSKKKKEE